jgi:hypothetical protein
MLLLFLTAFIPNFVVPVLTVTCPSIEEIYPCKCDAVEKSVTCDGGANFDIRDKLQKISSQSTDKNFSLFYLSNLGVEEIQEDIFSDLLFKRVKLGGNFNNIDRNAFSKSASYIREFSVSSTLNYPSNEQEFFAIVQTFSNLESLYITSTKLHSIPDHAFGGNLNKLQSLYISGKYFSTIDSYAFYNLPNLMIANFYYSIVSKIKRFALRSTQSSSVPLSIQLYNECVNDDTFEINSLTFANRPIEIIFVNSGTAYCEAKITYLNQDVFEPFLLSNENNTMIVRFNTFVCDCKMKWIIANGLNYLKQLGQIPCMDGREIWEYSLDEFNHCPQTKKIYPVNN